jgi:hypothetical protein
MSGDFVGYFTPPLSRTDDPDGSKHAPALLENCLALQQRTPPVFFSAIWFRCFCALIRRVQDLLSSVSTRAPVKSIGRRLRRLRARFDPAGSKRARVI